MRYKDVCLETEEKILAYWKKQKTVDFLRERDQGGAKFYFLEGPPYTSGKIHMGHAWNMALKDMVLRYKRAKGLDVWDRMGYDMHGLPTEQKTMAKLGLKDKQDIENFGLLKFRRECEKFCLEMKKQMDIDFDRLGVTLDYKDSYQPIKNSFIEGVWWLVKKAHEKGRLYQGLRTMHWDYATQSSVAKHELEYKSVKDTSIYVKFPVLDVRKAKLFDTENFQFSCEENTFFVIWTTTPWTIPLNLAVMVNPEIDYVTVRVELDSGEKENWVLAKALVESVVEKAKVKNHVVLSEFKGADLEGKRYFHPLGTHEFLPEELQQNPKLFSVLLTKEYCDDSSGTGLVHSAPGCGPEDYEVGHKNGIPPFNPVDEAGFFANFGPFTGLRAKLDDQKFVEMIKEKGVLLAKQSYTHDYPHGERSHEPVIFRTTKQWFFKIEDLKERLLKWNEDVHWVPKSAQNAFRGWLENLRDNSISKQRFWGTAVPIWKWEDSETGEEDYIVVGSLAELKELSGREDKDLKDLHVPAIDSIVIYKGGREYKRVPDVLDVWIDAGTSVWNCLDFPARTDLLKKYYPADFILEGKDQIRGWFNLLMIGAALGFDRLPFKSCFMHGFVTDVDGVKMSKSLGNIISPYEVIDKHGVDVLRTYMCRATAGEDVNFSWDELASLDRRLKIYWNLHKFVMNLSVEVGQNPFEMDDTVTKSMMGYEEKYIMSRLQSTISEVSSRMEKYELDKVPLLIDELFLDLSRNYLQMVREKSSVGSQEDKEVVLYTLTKVLFEGLKMAQIVIPFVTEAMYLNLREAFDLEEESISHFLWRKVDESYLDLTVEKEMAVVFSVIQAGLHAREQAKLGLRWPIKELVVVSLDSDTILAVEKMRDLLKEQLKVKDISVLESLPGVDQRILPNPRKIGPKFAQNSSEVMTKLGRVDSNEVLEQLAKFGVYKFVLDSGEQVSVDRLDLLFERDVPKGYTEGEFESGFAYMNLERSDELLAEGYARELMRHVQNARKKVGFSKSERILLHVTCPEDLVSGVSSFSEAISAKVGASKIAVVAADFPRKFEHQKEVKVREQVFKLGFEKEKKEEV